MQKNTFLGCYFFFFFFSFRHRNMDNIQYPLVGYEVLLIKYLKLTLWINNYSFKSS